MTSNGGPLLSILKTLYDCNLLLWDCIVAKFLLCHSNPRVVNYDRISFIRFAYSPLVGRIGLPTVTKHNYSSFVQV